jgi:hypothetical protein
MFWGLENFVAIALDPNAICNTMMRSMLGFGNLGFTCNCFTCRSRAKQASLAIASLVAAEQSEGLDYISGSVKVRQVRFNY